MNIVNYFEDLRFNPVYHLGLGDIRLTFDQQDEIITYVLHLEVERDMLELKLNKLRKVLEVTDDLE